MNEASMGRSIWICRQNFYDWFTIFTLFMTERIYWFIFSKSTCEEFLDRTAWVCLMSSMESWIMHQNDPKAKISSAIFCTSLYAFQYTALFPFFLANVRTCYSWCWYNCHFSLWSICCKLSCPITVFEHSHCLRRLVPWPELGRENKGDFR